MITDRFTRFMLCACLLALGLPCQWPLAQTKNAGAALDLPRLVKQGTAIQLQVHNRPFLLIAGELGNSSASSLEYLRPMDFGKSGCTCTNGIDINVSAARADETGPIAKRGSCS